MPIDKVRTFLIDFNNKLQVYGYFVRREDGEDEPLPLTAATVHKPIGDFSIEPEHVIIVDMSGKSLFFVVSYNSFMLFRHCGCEECRSKESIEIRHRFVVNLSVEIE